MQFLYRVVSKKSKHLWLTDQRLFVGANPLLQINQIENDPDLAERVEVFMGRFSHFPRQFAGSISYDTFSHPHHA